MQRKVVRKNIVSALNPTLPIRVTCDSSSYGVGCVLSHVVDGVEKPIAFASSTLSFAEAKYSQLEREGLAIIFAIKKFHKYLWGRKFLLVTDHQPLKYIFSPIKNIPVLSAVRLQRWAIILASYQYEIEYKKCQDIGSADGLSRLPKEISVKKAYISVMSVRNAL